MGGNQISGMIPEGIGQLIGLTNLVMVENDLDGTIPDSIGNLKNLVRLALQENKLSGNIPTVIGNLTVLFELYLRTNKLEGSIPLSLKYCTRMQSFGVADNNLSGDIPNQTFGNLEGFRLPISNKELRPDNGRPEKVSPGARRLRPDNGRPEKARYFKTCQGRVVRDRLRYIIPRLRSLAKYLNCQSLHPEIEGLHTSQSIGHVEFISTPKEQYRPGRPENHARSSQPIHAAQEAHSCIYGNFGHVVQALCKLRAEQP
ncbi:putative LRR receptor-like serine/threonine-protein kinase, partial [Mucuna pruriens]